VSSPVSKKKPARTKVLVSGAKLPSTATVTRCRWADGDPLMRAYHDAEWGRPERDSRVLWETLMLDGFQAGLSWSIILRKREGFRKAFRSFDPVRVAAMTDADVDRLMLDPGIVRARAKIVATIGNAKAYLAMQNGGEDFSAFVWGMAGGHPLDNQSSKLPTETPLSAAISRALKARGFKFVGSVTVYAWMQAVAIVNDHEAGCLCRR
jgi:DNA-3-methyladenine glycosylase I